MVLKENGARKNPFSKIYELRYQRYFTHQSTKNCDQGATNLLFAEIMAHMFVVNLVFVSLTFF